MFWCCLSCIGIYAVIGCLVDPVVDCPYTVDYILEINLVNCKQTKKNAVAILMVIPYQIRCLGGKMQ